MTELLATLSKSLSWDSTFLRLFLLDFSMIINANGVEHRALIVLIHQSMDEADVRKRPNKSLEFEAQERRSGIEAPPNSPCGTPPNSKSIWEYGIQIEEENLIQRLVSIQEFKIFLALFEVVMDIHEKHDLDFEETLTSQLMNEMEL